MPVTENRKFRIGVVQMSCSADPNENLEKTIWRIRDAAGEGARIICLQELFRSEYFCRAEDEAMFALAEPIPGPTTDSLAAVASETGAVIVAPLFERRAAGLYHNTAVVIDADGALLGSYRKMHIPDDPLYYEKFYFAPGDLGFRNFQTRYGRIGVLICWDQWFPEAARLASLQGASILFCPTAIGWHPSEKEEHGEGQLDAWKTVQRGHAIANGIYLAAANRVGSEGPPENRIEFWGSSFVAGPLGEIVAEASREHEEIVIADCDPQHLEQVRRSWPFLRDRRVDAYQEITKRWID